MSETLNIINIIFVIELLPVNWNRVESMRPMQIVHCEPYVLPYCACKHKTLNFMSFILESRLYPFGCSCLSYCALKEGKRLINALTSIY